LPFEVTFDDFFSAVIAQQDGFFDGFKKVLASDFTISVAKKVLRFQHPDNEHLAKSTRVLDFFEEESGFRYRELRQIFPMLKFLPPVKTMKKAKK